MSSTDKSILTKRFYEFEDEIGVNPETKNLNDHVLLVDGFNTFIRSFSVNPSLNEDGAHVGGLDCREKVDGISADQPLQALRTEFQENPCISTQEDQHA